MFELGLTEALISFIFCSCSLTTSILQCWATLWSLHGGGFPVYSVGIVRAFWLNSVHFATHIFVIVTPLAVPGGRGKSTSSFGTSISAQPFVPAPASQRRQVAGGSSLVNPGLKIVLWTWFLASQTFGNRESIAVHLAVRRRREGIYGNLLCSWSLIFMPLLMRSSSHSAAWVTIPPLYVFCIYSYFLLKFLGKRLSKYWVENFILK